MTGKLHPTVQSKKKPMKKICILIGVVTLIFSCKNEKQTITEEKTVSPISEISNKQPVIAILGTFHFANTSDYSAIVLEDGFSPKRQKEMKEIVAQLAMYRPTKILVEREPSYTDTLNLQFSKYLNNEFELPINELYQIGFRLAKKLGHKKLYGIDKHMNLGDEDLVAHLNKHGLMDSFSTTIKNASTYGKKHTAYLKEHSIGKTLITINTKEGEDFNRNLYLDHILTSSELENAPSITYVTNWYKRNIHIKHNIDRITEKKDRILVIIGAGHSAILNDFYRNSNVIQYAEITDYLTDE